MPLIGRSKTAINEIVVDAGDAGLEATVVHVYDDGITPLPDDRYRLNPIARQEFETVDARNGGAGLAGFIALEDRVPRYLFRGGRLAERQPQVALMRGFARAARERHRHGEHAALPKNRRMAPKKKSKPTAVKRAGRSAGGSVKNVSPPQTRSSSHPDVGEVLRRLRLQRKLSVRDVAEGCGISQSFLSMVERGDSDISLGRLEKIAHFFDQDIGSLLGYTTRLSKPHFITDFERTHIDRGPGIDYEVLLLPGLDIQIVLIKLGPKSEFTDAISHEGFDIAYVVKGDIVVCVGDDEYPMREGQCAYYSAAYRHRLLNRAGKSAFVLSITTGRMA